VTGVVRRGHGSRRPVVLCVDDEAVTLRLVTQLINTLGMDAEPATDARQALAAFDRGSFDLILSDIRMPGMDGLAFLREIRARDPDIPVVVATGFATLDTAVRCLREGATGMIMKPFTAEEFRTEIGAALDRARQRDDAIRYRLLSPILDGVALALTAAIEARHLETGDHCRELGVFGEEMAERLGLDEHERTTIRIGGYLHDVGKIAIADAVLLKPGRLTEAEYEEMKHHAEIGGAIVATHEAMGDIARIVRHHHERWDGAGYPTGMAGTAIPVGARIISVGDAFSAMTSDRVYRNAIGIEEAWRELRRNRGTQFDPEVVDAFEPIVARMAAGAALAGEPQPQLRRVDPRTSSTTPRSRISTGQMNRLTSARPAV
jgi:putative two-component system response regulator